MRSVQLCRSLRLVVALGALAVVATAAPASARGSSMSFPDVISLPNGWRPEGIVIGRGTNFYVGSLANGAIWHGNLRTGEGSVLVPGAPGQVTVGLEFDHHGRIWAAGGPTGVGKVFDARTGELLRSYPLAVSGSFINDVVVTRHAAYFTDSKGGRLFAVELGRGGRLPAPGNVRTIPLGGEFVASPTPNANGIETTPDGKALLVVQTATGQLFRVDPSNGVATNVPLSGVATNVLRGDGIVRRGTTLYVVQNTLNQIAVVKLDPHGTAGTISKVLTDGDLDVPATADLLGRAVYAVNARFTTTPGPDVAYQVVRVDR